MNLLTLTQVKQHACMLSCVQLFAIPWSVAHQALLSMEFSRQEYWSQLPFPAPGELPYSGIKLQSLWSPALAGRFFTTGVTWEAPSQIKWVFKRRISRARNYSLLSAESFHPQSLNPKMSIERKTYLING